MADTKLFALGLVPTPSGADRLYTAQAANGTPYGIQVQDLIAGGSKVLVATAVKTANYTAVASDLVIANTSGGAFTVTLPATPGFGQRVGIALLTAGNNLTVGRNGKNIDGAAADLTISVVDTLRTLEYTGVQWVTVFASGQAVLAADYTITASGAFQETGLALVLPTAGTYMIGYNTRFTIAITGHTAAYVECDLYNATAAAQVANSVRLPFLVGGTVTSWQAQSAFTHLITVTAPSTIRLRGFRDATGSPSWVASTVTSDVNGPTTMSYIKLG